MKNLEQKYKTSVKIGYTAERRCNLKKKNYLGLLIENDMNSIYMLFYEY